MLAHKKVSQTTMASGVAGFSGRTGRSLTVAKTSYGRQNTVRVAALKDATPLRQKAEAAVRETIKSYVEAYPTFPKVRFVLVAGQTQMGETWRLVGSSPELGRWCQEIGPGMTWQQGGKWVAEVKLPPGEHVFKCVLRRGDGQFQWEGGANRVLQVREGAKVVQVDMVPQSDEVPVAAQLVEAH